VTITEESVSHPGVDRVATLLLAAGILIAEILTTWMFVKVDQSIFFPAPFVAGVGLAGLLVLALIRLLPPMSGELDDKPAFSHLAGIVVVGTIAIIVAGVLLAIPLKWWTVEANATKVAESLVPANDGSTVCTGSPSDLSVVSSLMTPARVCTLGGPGAYVVEFQSAKRDDPSTNTRGLLFTPTGLDDPMVHNFTPSPECLRHLTGEWWVYEEMAPSLCPTGYNTFTPAT
jgi:hypothetical protein